MRSLAASNVPSPGPQTTPSTLRGPSGTATKSPVETPSGGAL